MTATTPAPRSRAAGAAILVAVLLLFGAATFVAGLVVGGSDAVGQADPSGGDVPSTGIPSGAATPEPPADPTPTVETVTCTEPSEAFAVLCEVYADIKSEYVDEVPDEKLAEGAVRGMVEYGLEDPYSGYLTPEQYTSAQDDLSGSFSGIGAEVGMENLANPDDLAACTVITETCVMVIVAPLDGSPAEAAGLRAGDQVIAVDGESTIGETVSSLVYKVRGEEGTDVTLTIRRGDEEMDITITRAVIELHEVSSEMLEDGIGYIRLTSFTDRAPGLFRDALTELLDQGATGIVFDLRSNPGGYIVAAQGIASQFIPEGELLFTVESGDDVQEWRAESGVAQDPSIEVVVLIDGGSASASEIVAAALKEHGRATLVGEPTFGKNTVQIWNDLPNGGGLRLTTDRWFTPNHNSAAPDGIQPDVLVEAPEDPSADEDPQLDRAVEILRGG
ncbi:MAG TPA: S41 family peptidase [Candidatus Limnocylindria bacterium]|nr:S41 family peptidase [Candidatus Limnocylindria bacterium]